MGSKRAMLKNGLGNLLLNEMSKHERVVDLFCGGGSISWFAATRGSGPVLAVDLQSYATTLAAAVIERVKPANVESLIRDWLEAAESWAVSQPWWSEIAFIDEAKVNTATWCKKARAVIQELPCNPENLILNSYGGHYFSLSQATLLDGMLNCLPQKPQHQTLCLASTIITASRCSASPGHTAQPFQPTRTAAKYLREAWKREPLKIAEQALRELGAQHANQKGKARVGDALSVASSLNSGDLVFVDPPYSDVHYSRFYHVLETISRREQIEVSGTGRYPPASERPMSSFSRKSEAYSALEGLLGTLAQTGATIIFTFPSGISSNGLSGETVKSCAGKWFSIEKQIVKSRFSTLGGNNSHRKSRHESDEMILVLKPQASTPSSK